MFYMGFLVVVVCRLRRTKTRPPRIVLFSLSSALAAVHTPRFQTLNVLPFKLIKFFADKVVLPTAFVFPN